MTVALPQNTDVRPGDQRAAAQVEEWFRTWQATGDPALLPALSGEAQLEDRLALPELLAGLPELERRAVMLQFFS
jgi:hypothetical protein